ncbi:MAG: hypothetical protein ACRYFZ_20120 [Janthinobacterium lividum]
MKNSLKSLLPLVALLLAVCLSFWLSPAPKGQPDVEYWGHYQRVGPGLGFIVNHDSYGYLQVAHEPGRLLQPREVRQSRPLYALLGAAAGYPFAVALRLAGRRGLVPAGALAQAHYYGIYVGYVLLNGLALLASLVLFKKLFNQFSAGRGESWQFYALAWVLVANPITKAFFWTAHQQMFAFLVPLGCLALAMRLTQRPVLRWAALSGWALALGLLPLLYGSFVLAWPALAFGLLGLKNLTISRRPRWPVTLGKLAVSAGLFAVPTLLWIGLLRTQGTTYYNHEAERFHQLVWLVEARHLPPTQYLALVASKLTEYVGSLQLMGLWLLAAAGLYAATAWRLGGTRALMPPAAGRAWAWVAGWFVLFFALLGYYPERLAFTLLPLVLCLGAALLPHWPRRYARPLLLATAAGWHLYVLLSYGPFS